MKMGYFWFAYIWEVVLVFFLFFLQWAPALMQSSKHTKNGTVPIAPEELVIEADVDQQTALRMFRERLKKVKQQRSSVPSATREHIP